MNCQTFETIINDLERGGPTDARTHDSAMAHVEACGRCAARLSDERMLTAGLRRLAAIAEAKEPPARIESALLAAFREQHQRGIAPITNLSRRRRRAGWAIATAATVLILLSLASLHTDRSPSSSMESAKDAKPEQKQIATGQSPPVQPSYQQAAAANARHSIHQRQAVSQSKPRAARRIARRSEDGAGPKPEMSGAEAAEIATEFIPLVHEGNLAPTEGGQIVRVELPRSALLSFGLPMNMERADERIKADVVLGNDGLARAIRFVR